MDSLCKEKSPIQEALAELKDISITPDQEKYKTFAEIYNPSYDQTPGFIAVPANTHDIKRCLQVAHKFGVPVAVKSGGHCFAGYSAIDSDGFVISMYNFKSVTRKNDIATVGAGAEWRNVYEELENSEYVAVGGCCTMVCVGGYVLGGGYGLLSRSHGGLACDKLISVSMVTADGQKIVVASAKENEELFWALKGGGGGNFGLVFSAEIRLSKKPKYFVWERLEYRGTENIKRAMSLVGKFLISLPKELNLDMLLHYNRLTLEAVYSDVNETAVIDVLNKFECTSRHKVLQSDSYAEFVEEYSKRHGYVKREANPIYIKGVLIDSLPVDLIDYFASLSIPLYCLLVFVHVGGDIKQVSPTSTAFPHRSAEYSFYTYGRYPDDTDFALTVFNKVKESGCAIGCYVNYMDRMLENWTEEYYGCNYNRLCDVKEKWNPLKQGGLHFQQEIGSKWEPDLSKT